MEGVAMKEPSVAEGFARAKASTADDWERAGYPEAAARALASGQLPRRLRQWPATPRYRVVELERGGMATEEAIAQVRVDWAEGK